MQHLGGSALSISLTRCFATARRPGKSSAKPGKASPSRAPKVLKFYQRQSKPKFNPLPVASTLEKPVAAPPKAVPENEEVQHSADDFITKIVRKDEDSMRLDRWIRTHYPSLTHSFVEKLLRKKLIAWAENSEKVAENKWKRVEGGQRVTTGSVVRVLSSAVGAAPPSRGPATAKAVTPEMAKEAKSWIIYEDDSMIVLNKPADLAVQGGSGIKRSLADYLPALMRPNADTLPALVHRLDQSASGLLVLARTKEAARKLAKSWADHDIRKLYWAVTVGTPRKLAGTLRTQMMRTNDSSGVKIALVNKKGERTSKKKHGESDRAEDDDGDEESNLKPDEVKMGITRYNTIAHSGDLVALLAMRPRTGRTHQLRVHCAEALSTPILGDTKYGPGFPDNLKDILRMSTPLKFTKPKDVDPKSKDGAKQEENFNKLHLHARELCLRHPQTGKIVHFVAPLPKHYQMTLDSFGLNVAEGRDISAFASLDAAERRLEEHKPVWMEQKEQIAAEKRKGSRQRSSRDTKAEPKRPAKRPALKSKVIGASSASAMTKSAKKRKSFSKGFKPRSK